MSEVAGAEVAGAEVAGPEVAGPEVAADCDVAVWAGVDVADELVADSEVFVAGSLVLGIVVPGAEPVLLGPAGPDVVAPALAGAELDDESGAPIGPTDT